MMGNLKNIFDNNKIDNTKDNDNQTNINKNEYELNDNKYNNKDTYIMKIYDNDNIEVEINKTFLIWESNS